MNYDFLIVGSGLYGATFAFLARQRGKRCLVLDQPNFQGNAVVNYTERSVPWTRIIEHKHFESFGQAVYDNPKTVISREFSTEWTPGMEPYYPVNDQRNSDLYAAYSRMTADERNVIFGGRLAE